MNRKEVRDEYLDGYLTFDEAVMLLVTQGEMTVLEAHSYLPRNIDKELILLRFVNYKIGTGEVLNDYERKGLTILGRVQEYLTTRRSCGEELMEREKLAAGKSTREFDEEVKNS